MSIFNALARFKKIVNQAFSVFYDRLIWVFDLILAPVQNVIGIKRMPYFFVLPNLLIFGIFILFLAEKIVR